MNKTEKTKDLRFSKDSILKSRKYSDRRDALNACLENGKDYTFDEIEKEYNKFMKG